MRTGEGFARLIAPISECLHEAAWGRATWNDVCRSFVGVMPDVVPIIRNVDLNRRTVNTMFVEGIKPEHITDYRSHYVALDPWIKAMEEVNLGQVYNTECHHPSASFRDSEFYNGWLSRQDSLKAATGLRIDIDASNAVIICLHYKVEQASMMDGPVSAMLNSLMPALTEAIRSSAMLRNGLERSPRLGSLIEHIRGDALLIDCTRRIFEANSRAVADMDNGEIFYEVGNTLMLRDRAAQRWLEEACDQVLMGREGAFAAAETFITDNQVYQVNVTRTPDYGGPDFDLLVHPKPYILVVIRQLTAGSLRLDFEALRLAYGLTPAETRLCEALANGYSLVESAHYLEISEGTVRQRAKAIFLKTGTHRQGELIARVTPFAIN